MYQPKKSKMYQDKNDVYVVEVVPPGLRICPMRPPRIIKGRDRSGYPLEREQFYRCRSDCALFDTERGCCGLRG